MHVLAFNVLSANLTTGSTWQRWPSVVWRRAPRNSADEVVSLSPFDRPGLCWRPGHGCLCSPIFLKRQEFNFVRPGFAVSRPMEPALTHFLTRQGSIFLSLCSPGICSVQANGACAHPFPDAPRFHLSKPLFARDLQCPGQWSLCSPIS